MRSYIAVTAHYLHRTPGAARGPLQMCSNLIGFLSMPGRHFAQDLAKGLLYVTDRAKITDKVSSILRYMLLYMLTILDWIYYNRWCSEYGSNGS